MNPTAPENAAGCGTASRERRIMLTIAVTGTALRVLYLILFSRLPHFSFAIGPDVMEYDARARELLDGIIFPASPEIHAPLYSYFLALVYLIGGGAIWFARSVQLALNLAAYWSLTLLLGRLGASFRVRAWFFALSLLTPVLIFHQAELISETLLAPLTAGFFWMMTFAEKRKGYLFAAGVFLGALVLTHGLMIFFAAAELIRALWLRRWRTAAALTAGAALMIAPAVLAKSLHYGKFTGIQSNGAFNLWIGHNPESDGGCYLRPGRMWRAPLDAAKTEARRRGVSESRVFLEKICRFYREEPGKALLLQLKKFGLLIAPWEPPAGADPEELIRRTPVQKYGAGAWAAATILALCGIYFAVKEKERRFVHFYLLAGSLAAALLLTVVSGRYRQGMMPGVMLLAAIGAVSLREKGWIIVLSCLTLAAWLKLPSPVMGYCETASIEGEAYYRLGDLDRAERRLKFAAYSVDDPARFDNMLGLIAEGRGEYDRAAKHYARVLELDPDFPDAWLNLGHLLFFHAPAQRQKALRLIGESLRRKEEQPSAYNMLGIDLVQRGDAKGAEKMFIKAREYDPGNEMYRQKIELCRRMAAERGKNAPESGHP